MDPKRVEQIFDEIATYTIDLEPDPTSLGPRYLHRVTAVCRNYQNAVSRILGEIHREKRMLSEHLRSQEAALKVESDELLANNDQVRRLPNIRDREATISVLLATRVREVEDLKREVTNLEHIEKAVRHRHDELKDTSSAIRLQRNLIRDEIDSGSFYGDERGMDRHDNGPTGSSVDEAELDRIMSEASKSPETSATGTETDAPSDSTTVPKAETTPELQRLWQNGATSEASTPESDEASIDRFLSGVAGAHVAHPNGSLRAEEEYGDIFAKA